MSVRFFSNFIKERRYIIYKILLTILFVFSSFFYLFSEAKASEVNNNLALYNDPTVSGLTKPRLCNGTCTTGGATLGQIYSFNWAWSIPDSVRAQITKYQLKVNSTINERAPEPNGTSPLYVYEFNGFKVGENVITVRICTNSGCGPWSDPLTLNINRGWSILCTVYHPTVSIDTIASNSGVIYKPSSALSLFTTDSDLGTVATFLGAKVGTKATLSLKGANGTCSQNINGSFIRNNITSSTFLGTATNKKRNLEITCTSGCANTGSVVTVNTTGGSTNTGNTVTPPPPTQLTSCFGTQPPVSQTVMSQNLPGKFIFGNGPFTTGSDLGKIAAFLGVPIGQSVNLQISDAGCIGTYNYDVRNFVTAIGWITPWRGMNVTCVGGCGANSGTGSIGGTNTGTGSTGNTGNTTGGSTNTGTQAGSAPTSANIVGISHASRPLNSYLTLLWSGDSKTTHYNLKVNTKIITGNISYTNASYLVNSQNGFQVGENSIYVRACNSAGCSPWSNPRTLTVTGDGVSGIDGGSIEINNNLSIYNEPLNTKFPKPKINGSGGNVKQSVYFGQSLSLFWAWSIPLSISYDSYQIKVNSTITEYDASSPTFSSKVTNLYVNDIIGFSVADDNKLSVRVCDVNGCSQWSDPMTIDVWLGWTKNMCSSSPIGLSIKVRVNNEGVIYGSGTSNSPFTTDSDLGTIAAFMGNKIGDVVTMNTDYNSMCMSTNDDTKVTKNGITTTPYNVNIRDQKRTMLVKCVEGCNGSGTGSTGSVSTVTPVFPSSGTASFRVVGADMPIDVGANGNIMVVTLGSAGIRIVDISNASSPKVLSDLKLVDNTLSSPIKSKNIFVSGTKAYVTSESRLFIIDISNPSKPKILGIAGASKAKSITVVGNYAYMIGAYGLEVWNISNPANPVKAGGSSLPNGQATGVYVANQMAFIYGGIESPEVRDLRNLTKIMPVTTLPTGPANDITGGGMYVATNEGLTIVESVALTDSIHRSGGPSILGKFSSPDPYKGVEFYGGKVYAVRGTKLQAIDVSDKKNPVLAKNYTISGGLGLAIDKGIAFIPTSSGVTMVELE